MKTLTKNPLLLVVFASFIFVACDDDDDESSYKTYSSLLTQENQEDPTENVLINELDITIEWTREEMGIFKGVLSKPVDLDETTMVIQLQQYNRIPTGGFIDSQTIEFHNCDRFNLYDARDGLTNAVIEIKSFH